MSQEDIDITGIRITDSFSYGGKTYEGLDDLRKSSITNYSKTMGELPYAVRVEESYPCFDSSDSMYENRSYQTYFLTMDEEKASRICKETTWEYHRYCRDHYIEEIFKVMEPMFSMRKIKEIHLPFIYYHGEGDTMEVVQDRNAKDKVEIIKEDYISEYEDPELDISPVDEDLLLDNL